MERSVGSSRQPGLFELHARPKRTVRVSAGRGNRHAKLNCCPGLTTLRCRKSQGSSRSRHYHQAERVGSAPHRPSVPLSPFPLWVVLSFHCSSLSVVGRRGGRAPRSSVLVDSSAGRAASGRVSKKAGPFVLAGTAPGPGPQPQPTAEAQRKGHVQQAGRLAVVKMPTKLVDGEACR